MLCASTDEVNSYEPNDDSDPNLDRVFGLQKTWSKIDVKTRFMIVMAMTR